MGYLTHLLVGGTSAEFARCMCCIAHDECRLPPSKTQLPFRPTTIEGSRGRPGRSGSAQATPPIEWLARRVTEHGETAGQNLWRRRESNSQPPPCKGGALPIELRPLVAGRAGHEQLFTAPGPGTRRAPDGFPVASSHSAASAAAAARRRCTRNTAAPATASSSRIFFICTIQREPAQTTQIDRSAASHHGHQRPQPWA